MYRKIQYAKIFGGGGEDAKPATASITNKHREDWNKYVKWLESNKLRGNPELDKGDMGKQVLARYIKENPNTSLTLDIVKPIQSDFANYRNYALDQVKQGKMALAEGVTPETFMAELSKLDAYPGSRTTSHSFPFDYMRYVDKSKGTDTTINKGFAVRQ